MSRALIRPTGLAEAHQAAEAALEAAALAVEKIALLTEHGARRSVLIYVKVSEGLAIALAERAEVEGITQKQVITRALAAAGLPVDPLDVEDRTPRRQRAA